MDVYGIGLPDWSYPLHIGRLGPGFGDGVGVGGAVVADGLTEVLGGEGLELGEGLGEGLVGVGEGLPEGVGEGLVSVAASPTLARRRNRSRAKKKRGVALCSIVCRK
jgi:hypothetical protein